MGIIGDIIDEYYEHKHRESVSNIENDTEKIIENHDLLKRILVESMLESHNKNQEFEKQFEYLHFKIDKIEKLLLEASRRFFCPLAPNLQLSQLNQGS